MNYEEAETGDNEDINEIPLVDDELSFENDFTADEEPRLNEAEEEEEEENLRDGKKTKNQNNKTFSLQARRAIEDHLEQRRLRKELDYLFDDEFANNNEFKEK